MDLIKDDYSLFNKLTGNLNMVMDEEDLAIMKQADVIGMTTTGAAKYREVLSRLDVSV